jgi:gamma-glutamylcyclotransferase (GGCT)/AIG2-like uncharacterized protein YtfP
MPLIFSYGTLQHADVQLVLFGRTLSGERDALPGFALTSVASGGATHANVRRADGNAGATPGTAFTVTDDELTATDRYEAPFGYVRREVTLESGRRAWVYVYQA